MQSAVSYAAGRCARGARPGARTGAVFIIIYIIIIAKYKYTCNVLGHGLHKIICTDSG